MISLYFLLFLALSTISTISGSQFVVFLVKVKFLFAHSETESANTDSVRMMLCVDFSFCVGFALSVSNNFIHLTFRIQMAKYSCELCEKSYTTKQNLKNHALTHLKSVGLNGKTDKKVVLSPG